MLIINATASILIIAATGQVSLADDIAASLTKLEGGMGKITRAELREAFSILRTGVLRGDQTTWQRLRRIVLDEKRHQDIRVEAMKLACEKADKSIANDILSIVNQWSPGLDDGALPSKSAVRQNVVRARSLLREAVATEGVVYLQQVLENQQPLLEFLTKRQYLSAIIDNPAPIEMRRACVIKVIAARKQSTIPSQEMLALLDASSFRALRQLVRESSDPYQFHCCAASVLAHLGDQEIVPDLKVLRPVFQKEMPSLARLLETYIWMINIQHPPAKLLEFVASSEDRDLWISVRRGWAMRRSLELGIPREQIRKALLTHINHFQDIKDTLSLQRVIQLKQAGLDLGVLQADDLPSVPEPPFIKLRGSSGHGKIHEDKGRHP